MSNSLPFLMLEVPCGSDKNCASCEVTPCSDATRIQDATRLIQAGARATLVCQLTDLPKKLVKRMYTMLQGQPSPRGQMPFTDAWYLETDLRMLHATLVWQLHGQISRKNRSEAHIILEVFAVYQSIVNTPLLNLTRTVVVLRLVAMALWHERQCQYCGNTFLAPTDEKHDIACPGCRLYHRYRCYRCGTAFDAQAMGRPRTVCSHCSDSKTHDDNPAHGGCP